MAFQLKSVIFLFFLLHLTQLLIISEPILNVSHLLQNNFGANYFGERLHGCTCTQINCAEGDVFKSKERLKEVEWDTQRGSKEKTQSAMFKVWKDQGWWEVGIHFGIKPLRTVKLPASVELEVFLPYILCILRRKSQSLDASKRLWPSFWTFAEGAASTKKRKVIVLRLRVAIFPSQVNREVGKSLNYVVELHLFL